MGPQQRPPLPRPEASDAIETFVIELGLALHSYGTPADQLEAAMARLANRFGIPAHFLATPTSIIASFGQDARPHIYLVRGDQGEVDLGKLSQLEQLGEAVVRGEQGPQQARALVASILRAPAQFGHAAVISAYGACSGAIARLFGGGWPEVVVAAFIGLGLGAMGYMVQRHPALARLYALWAAVTSSFLATAAAACGPLNERTATLAGLIILVPGLSTTTALTELATGNLVAGTSRLMGAVVTFMQLGFGVALGTQIGHTLLGAGFVPLIHLPGWTEWPAVTLAAWALGVMLQAQRRDFIWLVLCAVAGLATLRLARLPLGEDLAPFCAALVVTLAANAYASKFGRTASVLQVPAMLLLVPGSIGYRSVAALMDRNVVQGMQTAATMGVDAVALVAGALLAGLLLPPHKDF